MRLSAFPQVVLSLLKYCPQGKYWSLYTSMMWPVDGHTQSRYSALLVRFTVNQTDVLNFQNLGDLELKCT